MGTFSHLIREGYKMDEIIKDYESEYVDENRIEYLDVPEFLPDFLEEDIPKLDGLSVEEI